jgi:hypothetical protein
VSESSELTELNESLSRESGETSAWPARVIVETRDGREFDSGVVVSDPGRLVSREVLENKFNRLASPHLIDRRVDLVKNLVEDFQKVDEVEELTELLV